MAKDPAFLFYPGDYLRDTQCLSEASQVAYDRIMCEHMRNICEDMSKIVVSKQKHKFFTKRLNDDEMEELSTVLIETEDGFQIDWVAQSMAERKAYTNSRSKNRSKSNKKNPEKATIISKTYDQHMEDEDEDEDEIEDKDENINGIEDSKQEMEVVNFYNTVCDRLPRVEKLTHARKKLIQARLNEYTPEDMGEIFIRASKSDFLNGKSDRGWRANFDWILTRDNFLKIKEGNYDGITKNNGGFTEEQLKAIISDPRI
jgi:hypothetical protein